MTNYFELTGNVVKDTEDDCFFRIAINEEVGEKTYTSFATVFTKEAPELSKGDFVKTKGYMRFVDIKDKSGNVIKRATYLNAYTVSVWNKKKSKWIDIIGKWDKKD